MRHSSGIRPAAVAGLFYPGDPEVLARDVDRLMAANPAPPGAPSPRAVLAPHAGYRYSGAVAARAFSWAAPAVPEIVVLIGPSHVEAFDFTSVFDGEAFVTPLGEVPVDTELARRIASAGGGIRVSPAGHVARTARGEHALEVMIPFIQRAVPGARIVPITMGSQSRTACVELADALGAHLDPARTLVVASSDLSHFHPYEEAVALDSVFCELVATLDGGALLDGLAAGRCEACGGGPTAVVMLAAAHGGAERARVLARINSGDVTGERESVVGYAAAVFGNS